MRKRIVQVICRHKWPVVYFALDEYRKEYTCPKCGKVRVVYIGDKPEYVNVLPTDYYAHKEKEDTNTSDR